MEINSTQFGNFANYGFIKARVPDDLLVNLRKEISELDFKKSVPFNNNLAGNINLEFKLEKNKDQLEKFLVEQCQEYSKNWNITYTTRDLRTDDLELYSHWVNIQYKNEFNPMHSHDGIFSFAMWISVPYFIGDELSRENCKNSNSPRAGMFSFIYTNIFGEIREAEFPVDKTYEGYVFIFPSCLQHTVYPFASSDEPRISISGNIKRR
jgi:hypothetical protein